MWHLYVTVVKLVAIIYFSWVVSWPESLHLTAAGESLLNGQQLDAIKILDS